MVLSSISRRLPRVIPDNDYRKMQRRVHLRLIKLHSMVADLTPRTSILNDERIAFVVVESLNLWVSFTRSYYLSWFLNPKTISGHRVICRRHFNLFEDALVFAIRRLRNRNYRRPHPSRLDEPSWHNPGTILTLAAEVGVSNLLQVQSAFSLGATYPASLPSARNFYAHRNEETYRKVQDRAETLGFGRSLRPCEFLCTPMPLRPQNLIADWLDEIRVTVEF